MSAVPEMKRIQGEEWSVLYVDGKLERIGDSYLIDERIRELAGVVELDEGNFWDTVNDYDDAPKTLEEAYTLITPPVKVNAEGKSADDLKAEAQKLLDEAAKLS